MLYLYHKFQSDLLTVLSPDNKYKLNKSFYSNIIDGLPLDYSILKEIDYKYPANNSYFGYMTRNFIKKCAFCAVSHLEPNYKDYIGIRHQLEYVDEHFGTIRDLLLMDNSIFASLCFDIIIDKIKSCGFGKGVKYHHQMSMILQSKTLSQTCNGSRKM